MVYVLYNFERMVYKHPKNSKSNCFAKYLKKKFVKIAKNLKNQNGFEYQQGFIFNEKGPKIFTNAFGQAGGGSTCNNASTCNNVSTYVQGSTNCGAFSQHDFIQSYFL